MFPSSKGSRLYRTCLNFSLFQLNPLISNDHSRNEEHLNRFDVSHQGTWIPRTWLILNYAAAGLIARSTQSFRLESARACNAVFSRDTSQSFGLFFIFFYFRMNESVRMEQHVRARISSQNKGGESQKMCLVDDVSEGTDHVDYSRVSNALTAAGERGRGKERKTVQAMLGQNLGQLLHRRIHVRAHACEAIRVHSSIARLSFCCDVIDRREAS